MQYGGMTNTPTPNPLPEVLSQDHVFLAVESTDLDGRIIKIQISDHNGNFILDTLVHPRWKIKKGNAQLKHHITDEMASNAPRWKDLLPTIANLTQGKKVIVYNAKFMSAVFYTTSLKYHTPYLNLDLFCLMEATAQIIGIWSEYRQAYIPVKLFDACFDNSIKYNDHKKALMLYELANVLKNK